jgi:hypothetical protein
MKDTTIGKGFILLLALLFIAAGIAVCGNFYHLAELTCSRDSNTCNIVRTTPLGETRMSFRLSGITGAEKTGFKNIYGTSSGRSWHIALHTMDGDRYLTTYDTGIGEKKMDKNIKEIKDFIDGNAAHTLVVRQDDRIIALASLPLFGCGIYFFVLLRRWIKSEENYP